jgi:hypothetical protein
MGDEGLKHRERAACTPEPIAAAGFNPNADLPYSLTTDHVRLAMKDFTGFLGFVNQQLNTRDMERLESIVMPANFSSIVGLGLLDVYESPSVRACEVGAHVAERVRSSIAPARSPRRTEAGWACRHSAGRRPRLKSPARTG